MSKSASIQIEPRRELHPWKTIALGTYANPRDLLLVLLRKCDVAPIAEAMIETQEFTLAKQETQLSLVNVAADELNLSYPVTTSDVYARASQVGLGLCPAEVGPQLRLQYMNQPHGEKLLIAMHPFDLSFSRFGQFRVRAIFDVRHRKQRDSEWKLSLAWGGATPERLHHRGERFVFQRSELGGS